MWNLVLSVPGGHRYFAASDGRIAIADDSGSLPERIEDGICWVDITRKIRLDLKAGSIAVPIVFRQERLALGHAVESLVYAADVVAATNLTVEVTGSRTELLLALALNGLRSR